MSEVLERVSQQPEPTPPEDDHPVGRPAALTPGELLRWSWRQLTSMRTALLLLFLLAIAAIPGSLVPQREGNPLAAASWAERNPALAPWAERLGLFDVYSSPWFSAVYLLLMVSLVGCIIPRARLHARAAFARPPAPPRSLQRLPASRSFLTNDPPDVVVARAHGLLGGYRVDEHAGVDAAAGGGSAAALSAERGHWRETGNLLFHLSLVIVLVAVAVGSLVGYRASALTIEGGGFSNSPIQYDSLQSGPWFDPTDLPPFTLTLDRFLMDFREAPPNVGTPEQFRADVTVVEAPGDTARRDTISVNDPLSIDGATVHVLNPGYAPRITVRDSAGTVVFDDSVAFLPQDDTFASIGVVKVQVPDGRDLGLQAFFFPTAVADTDGALRSAFPEPLAPTVVLRAWRGDLGLDDGSPQSIYRLDTRDMTRLTQDGDDWSAAVPLGDTVELPDGAGSVTFADLSTWANLQVSSNPGAPWALAGSVLAIAGLLGSLYVTRRRLWVRATATPEGQTLVEVAGLDRADNTDIADAVDELATALAQSVATPEPPSPPAAPLTHPDPVSQERT